MVAEYWMMVYIQFFFLEKEDYLDSFVLFRNFGDA